MEEAVGKERYGEAKQLADAVMQRGTPAERVTAAILYGRILLGLGQKDPARQYLATMARTNLDAGASRRMAIYGAWLRALDTPDEGIKILEKMLEKAAAHRRDDGRGRRRACHALHGPRRAGEGEEGG